MKRLNKTESPVFVLLCVLCFQRHLQIFILLFSSIKFSLKAPAIYTNIDVHRRSSYYVAIGHTIFDLGYTLSYKISCAPSEDSDLADLHLRWADIQSCWKCWAATDLQFTLNSPSKRCGSFYTPLRRQWTLLACTDEFIERARALIVYRT